MHCGLKTQNPGWLPSITGVLANLHVARNSYPHVYIKQRLTFLTVIQVQIYITLHGMLVLASDALLRDLRQYPATGMYCLRSHMELAMRLFIYSAYTVMVYIHTCST